MSSDLAELKRAATGRWPEILSRLGGIDQRLLDGKHHPCPRCQGKDRFRLLDEADGAVFCNNCFSERNGDGFAALQWALGCEFPEAKRMVEEYLQVPSSSSSGHRNGKSATKADPLEQVTWLDDDALLEDAITTWCGAKRGITPEAVRRYAPRLCRWPKSGPASATCIAFLGRCSLFGEVRSVLLHRADGSEFPASGSLGPRKSHLVKGSQESWLWPGGLEALNAAKKIAKCEGLPDALALASVMPDDWLCLTNACGAKSTRKLGYRFAANKPVTIFADADRPGIEGAELHAAAFQTAGASNVRIVVPPYEVSPDHGKDIRDWLVEGHTAAEVNALVAAAKDPSDSSSASAPIATGSKTWERRYREGVEQHGTGLNARPPQVEQSSKAPLRYVPFPVELFPKPVRRFIQDVAKAVRVDHALVVQPTLAVLSTAIGGTVRFSPKRGWYEPATLWPLVLSDSGSGKSPAAKPPLKILQRIQSEAFRKHDAAMAQHNQDILAYEVAKKAWQSSGMKRGEPAPEKPEEPACHRLITSDVTMEKLAVLLDENERGMLLWRDEWSGWLKSFDAYKSGRGGDLGHWLSIWSAESIYVDRKVLGKRPIYVNAPFCSLHGGCQPDIWARLLRNGELIECGLIARFLVAMPPRSSQLWTEDDIDDAVADAMKDVVTNLLAIPLEHDDEGEQKPRILKLTTEAKGHFAAWHDRLAQAQEGLSGNLAAFYSKLKGMAIRLAGVVQLTRWASGDDARDDRIDLESIRAGCQIASWFAYEAKRIDGAIRETPEERQRRFLIEKIQTMGGRTTVRNLCRRVSRLMGKAGQAEKELLDLQKLELGAFEVIEPGPEGGQPTREFVLFSPQPTDTTCKNDGEDEVVSMSMVDGETQSECPEEAMVSQEGDAEWVELTI